MNVHHLRPSLISTASDKKQAKLQHREITIMKQRGTRYTDRHRIPTLEYKVAQQVWQSSWDHTPWTSDVLLSSDGYLFYKNLMSLLEALMLK